MRIARSGPSERARNTVRKNHVLSLASEFETPMRNVAIGGLLVLTWVRKAGITVQNRRELTKKSRGLNQTEPRYATEREQY